MKPLSRLSRRRFLTSSVAVASAIPFSSALATHAYDVDDSLSQLIDIPPVDIAAQLDAMEREVFLQSPPGDFSDLNAARQGMNAYIASLPPLPDDVTLYEKYVPSFDNHDILLRVLRPNHLTSPAPVLYWTHGGGLFMANAALDDPLNVAHVLELGIVVVSVEYRLAPEFPYPTPLRDCYYGLLGMVAKSEEWGIDPNNIVIGGSSAGGGLTAALAMIARDFGGPPIRFQFLGFPMLDDRNQTYSSYAIADPRVWNREANLIGWNHYLNDKAGSRTIKPYASPGRARVKDLSNLPPAYINIGTLDMFLDESINYARKLLRAGVPTELHVYPGVFHASNIFVPDSPLSQRWRADERNMLRRAFGL